MLRDNSTTTQSLELLDASGEFNNFYDTLNIPKLDHSNLTMPIADPKWAGVNSKSYKAA